MGFGSYDESEQENQQINTDLDDDDVDAGEAHDGAVTFEFGASNDELLDRLGDMKDDGE
ncbi:DUF5786 family protein [Halomarina rubra]|uniref:DUF5786 family protein n=1 Tax=Halomarina rubra TaxID=2071873 RepID=A0ABD6AVG1_9EURY|nr:DUF5786 family protein [Halomarina rubra]